MTDITPWFFVIAIPLLILLRLLAGRLDRQRIREYVENGGGKVIEIIWNPFGPGSSIRGERIYDVRYKNRNGEIHTSTCKTSMGGGVYWTGHHPPSGSIDDEESASEIIPQAEEPDTPAEPITCLGCGTLIHASQTRCPHCGWSYKESSSAS